MNKLALRLACSPPCCFTISYSFLVATYFIDHGINPFQTGLEVLVRLNPFYFTFLYQLTFF